MISYPLEQRKFNDMFMFVLFIITVAVRFLVNRREWNKSRSLSTKKNWLNDKEFEKARAGESFLCVLRRKRKGFFFYSTFMMPKEIDAVELRKRSLKGKWTFEVTRAYMMWCVFSEEYFWNFSNHKTIFDWFSAFSATGSCFLNS